ncbi:MAG: four helix bundle protein [Patescibacteria group bacterium]
MKFTSYKDLIVWQKSIILVTEVYSITKQFPQSEIYALSSQMQRAAISIPSNIAEGYKRNHRLEFIQFLSVANGSAGELETQLVIAKKLYSRIEYEKIEPLMEEVQKMLSKLITSMKTKH